MPCHTEGVSKGNSLHVFIERKGFEGIFRWNLLATSHQLVMYGHAGRRSLKERAMPLLQSELQLPSALKCRQSDWRPGLRPYGCERVLHTTVRAQG